MLAAFVAWLVLRTVAIWRARRSQGEPIDGLLTRAATIVVVLILVHSLFDYPLRTTAIAAIFAFGCGLLFPVPLPAAGAYPSSRARCRRSSGRPQSGPREDVGRDKTANVVSIAG